MFATLCVYGDLASAIRACVHRLAVSVQLVLALSLTFLFAPAITSIVQILDQARRHPCSVSTQMLVHSRARPRVCKPAPGILVPFFIDDDGDLFQVPALDCHDTCYWQTSSISSSHTTTEHRCILTINRDISSPGRCHPDENANESCHDERKLACCCPGPAQVFPHLRRFPVLTISSTRQAPKAPLILSVFSNAHRLPPGYFPRPSLLSV
ncbi:hypothetical protein V8E55_009674 [Tylopilus felleus]